VALHIPALSLRALILVLQVLLVPLCVHAQEQTPTNQTSAGDDAPKEARSSPEALRKRKLALTSELENLRAQLAERKKDLDEIKLVELDLLAGKDMLNEGASIIAQIERKPAPIFDGELEQRAKYAIRSANPIPHTNPERFTSYAARKLAIELARGPEVVVPAACQPKPGPTKATTPELDLIVSACINAVTPILAETAKDQTAKQSIEKVKSSLQQEISQLSTRINETEAKLLEVDNSLGTSNDLTEIIVKWTIPTLGILLVMILVGPKWYRTEIQQEIFSSRIILDLLTVYILVSTILILGLANRIQNEVLGTLLGGISGYVLGRSANAARERERERERPAPEA
jgi:hypothetical protein